MALQPNTGRLEDVPEALAARAVELVPPAIDASTIDEQAPMRAVLRRETVYRRALAIADVLSAAVAVLVALNILGDDRMKPIALLAVPLIVLVAKVRGLYDRDAQLLKKTTLDEAPELFGVATLYTLLLSVGGSHLVTGGLGAMQTVVLWGLLFGTSLLFRVTARSLACRLAPRERCLVIGTHADARRVATKFAESRAIKADLVGRVPLEAGADDGDGEVLAPSIEHLEWIVFEHEIHRVLVAPHGPNSEHMLEVVRAAKALGVQVSVLPRMLEVIGSSVRFDHLDGLTVMGVPRFGLSRSSRAIKRALDLCGAGLLLLLLSPIGAAIAVAVKLSSAGPVFFRQRRIGRDGRAFDMIKFRSMVVGAEKQQARLVPLNEAEGLFKISDDPRVTRVGRLLRRTSLDELPQLINVLRGEMSLVGPRPLVPHEDQRIEGSHRRRLHLKPGMTGQWQVYGSSRIPLREMVTIDYLYVANWSLWGDMKILCRTLPHMLGGRGR